MTAYEICVVALLIGGLGPALIISATGDPVNRLVGLDLAAATLTLTFILLSEVSPSRSYDLVLPLVLVPASFAGTLVFTRLLAPPSDGER